MKLRKRVVKFSDRSNCNGGRILKEIKGSKNVLENAKSQLSEINDVVYSHVYKKKFITKKKAKSYLQQLLQMQPIIQNSREDMRQVCEKLQKQMSSIISSNMCAKVNLKMTGRYNWTSSYKSISSSSSFNSIQIHSSSDPDTNERIIGASSQSNCNSKYNSLLSETNNSTAALLQEISSSRSESESQINIVTNESSKAQSIEATVIPYDSDETICSQEDKYRKTNSEDLNHCSETISEGINNDTICSQALVDNINIIPNGYVEHVQNNTEILNDDCSQPIFDFDSEMYVPNNKIGIANPKELTNHSTTVHIEINGETICSQALEENINENAKCNIIHENNGKYVKILSDSCSQPIFNFDNATLHNHGNIHSISNVESILGDATIIYETCVSPPPQGKNVAVTLKSIHGPSDGANISKRNTINRQDNIENGNINVKEIHKLECSIIAMNIHETFPNTMDTDWENLNENEIDDTQFSSEEVSTSKNNDILLKQSQQILGSTQSRYHAMIAPGETVSAQEQYNCNKNLTSSIRESSNIIEDSQVFSTPTPSKAKHSIDRNEKVANKKHKIFDSNELNQNITVNQTTEEMYKWIENVTFVRLVGSGEYFSNTILPSDFWDNPVADLPNEFLKDIHVWDDMV